MYKYETHMHTYEGSACGQTHGADYPAYYQSIGYAGIIITDHFFRGNTRAPRTGEWKDRVEAYCSGYEAAKEAGDRIGFPVFFGIEENFEGDEILIYGLTKEWMIAHPQMEHWNRTEYYDAVQAAGGLIVQAHPFRERDYLNAVHLNLGNCDAWEGYNAFNDDGMNHRAITYAKEHDIFITAGSDMHKIGSKEEEGLFGMAFETPLTDIADYVRRIKAHEGTPAVISSRQWTHPVDITTTLPMVIHQR